MFDKKFEPFDPKKKEVKEQKETNGAKISFDPKKKKVKEQKETNGAKISPLEKITKEQKQQYLEKAGRTTILREVARNLKRIKRNLDAILLIITIFTALATGLLLGYKQYIISILPGIFTLVFGIITYTLPPGDLKDAVDNFENTIIKK